MTENEALEELKTFPINCLDFKENQALQVAIQALSEIQQYRAIGTVEEVKMLKDYKELYDAYLLIGTIEEFRNLKYKKNFLPIATIEFSKEDMQKMVDEKVAQIELDIQEIRAKAIDGFAETLKEKYEEHNFDLCLRQNDYYSYSNSCMLFESYIDEIAEQMKAGGIDG